MDIVTRQITIERPSEVVRAQFADVTHHERAGVHRNVRFTVLDESPTHCEYQQVSNQGPLRIKQSMRLDRSDLDHQVNTVVAGAFRGSAIRFDVDANGPASTTVTAAVQSPRRLHRLLKPLLGPLLARQLGKALVEDKHDLESGTYDSAVHD